MAKFYDVDHGMLSRLAAKQTMEPVGKRRSDAITVKAARAFLARLDGQYVEALLYGSRARGDHKPDGDADIAVILKGQPRISRAKAVLDLSDAADATMLETGIVIQPFPIWESELKRPERFSNPTLLENIKREGIRL